jgi:hypothetical protein
MVYSGLMKEEDAQCFSVQGNIEPGAIILAIAALLLALLNTFVNKAVLQYFHDGKIELENKLVLEGEMQLDVVDEGQKGSEDTNHSMKIHPVQVFFTDTFRWLLRSENSEATS